MRNGNLIGIRAYTKEKWGIQQAITYIKALEKRFIQIAENPNLGKERPEIKPGYRSLVEGKHVIFYRVTHSGVEILGVPHTNMDLVHRLGPSKQVMRAFTEILTGQCRSRIRSFL
ncbi:MAG: type II toxin-antitoxin system RelE/ParE family toxin [Gammaproteobacteria bacterium]|nr:type II toxin-antitoxin system RelE/ParE family toxin [Gammaproteobacteria bacterium]